MVSFEEVKVAHVDCVANADLCASQDIRGYPTIRLYPLGSKGLNTVAYVYYKLAFNNLLDDKMMCFQNL